MEKVLITGSGMVTSLGNSVSETFEHILEGRSAVKKMPDWVSYKGLHCHLAAPAGEVDISAVPRQARRTMSRMSTMMVYATQNALKESGIEIKDLDPMRVLIIAGSTTGSPQTYKDYFFKAYEVGGPEGQMGTSFFKVMNHSVASNLAAALDFPGPILGPSCACATSAQAMIMGWEYIKSGLYDLVIAGGADELHHTSAEVFDIVFAASRGFNENPDLSPRPFDKKRDGLVVSEGASCVILESESHFKKRKSTASIKGLILGGAHSCAGAHMSKSDNLVMKDVILESLKRSGLKPSELQYGNAHATATIQGDEAEAKAFFEVFGKDLPVSSLKGHLGHSLAPCGGIEAILTLEMMKRQTLLPTRNLVEIAPECVGPRHLMEPEKLDFHRAVSTNFAFGGINTSLILGSPALL